HPSRALVPMELSCSPRGLLVEAQPPSHMGAGRRTRFAGREEDRMQWPVGFHRSQMVAARVTSAARMTSAARALVIALAMTPLLAWPSQAADEPDLIFRKSTVFRWMSPNDKLGTYAVDDPEVEGVACHFTVPEKGGFKGWIGVAEEVSD